MEDDTKPERFKPANDNIGPHGEPDAEKPSAETWRKIDRVALTLARIIGRRMAREDFAARAERQPAYCFRRIGGEADKD